jgi:hypothetical protein
MKSAPESSGIFSKAAQSSTGPREAVKFTLGCRWTLWNCESSTRTTLLTVLFCFCFALSSHEVQWPAVQLQVDQLVRSNIYSSIGL